MEPIHAEAQMSMASRLAAQLSCWLASTYLGRQLNCLVLMEDDHNVIKG